MTEQRQPSSICPCLGLIDDPDTRFAYPETAHRCFARQSPAPIFLEHQTTTCFSPRYATCEHFNPVPSQTSLDSPATAEVSSPQPFSVGRIVLWGLALILSISTISYYAFFLLTSASEPTAMAQSPVSFTTTPVPSTALAIPITADDGASAQATPAAIFLVTPPATLTPVANGRIYTLSPDEGDIGWVTSGEDRGNHFGDSFLYAGIYQGEIYHSAFQFDLSSLPRGAPIHSASLQLTGLNDERLSKEDIWTIRILAPEVDQEWRRKGYQEIFNAPTLFSLTPILGRQDLAVGQVNVFELSPTQIRVIEDQVIDDENPTLSFRLDGPLFGQDNMFAWDSGYGPKSRGHKVTLTLNVGAPPETPPAYDYIVVTSTPTPENVITAAAVALQMTAEATQIGTVTPPPPNQVTATPIPEDLIITATPTPENEATAQTQAALATAKALVTGTATPFPTNAVTATPTPTETPTPTLTPTPTYIIITSTPTPPSIFRAATMSAAITSEAERNGTATPLPENWVTPIIVTATPTPMNEGTVQALAQIATAQAFTTGTPTPIPANVQTATPTVVFELIEAILTPTPAVLDLPTPAAMPEPLIGKIAFLSDREEPAEGDKGQPRIYILDPETGQLGRLTARWPYEMALNREVWSADERFRLFTKDTPHYIQLDTVNGQQSAKREDVPTIFWYDTLYQAEEQLTFFGQGLAYGGVWSPISEQITFVSNDSGDDEIWTVNRDGTNLLQLTDENRALNAREIGKDTFIPEINKHPSFSPDGSQIIFYSTRTGNRQLWIMNRDGSEQRLLMAWTSYNDWDPVWIKYPDAPPPLTQ